MRRQPNAQAAKPLEREPLATPYEVAQLAVSLALMNGETQPDLERAVELLRKAAMRVQEEKRPRVYFAGQIMAGTLQEAEAMKPHPTTVAMSPDTHPDVWKQELAGIKSRHPNLTRVREPRFPATEGMVLGALMGGRREQGRLKKFRERINRACPSLIGLSLGAHTKFDFWGIAQIVAPFIRQRTRGQAQQKRTDEGRFKKSAKT